MDRIAILCIMFIICVIFAYIAGRMDAKKKVQREIEDLKRTIKLTQTANETLSDWIKHAKTTLIDIRNTIKTPETIIEREENCE